MFVQAASTIHAGEPGERQSRRAARRTHQPVRRRSRLAGKDDRLFWRPTSSREVWQIVKAAERYDEAARGVGERNGPLGHVALEILRLFARTVHYRTGRLDPSYAYICRQINRSKDAVHRALQALKAHGFLDWLRRYEPTEGEGRGPQVRQVSNAYRLFLPQKALQWLGRFLAPAPLPDDFSHATEARSGAMVAYEATLLPEDLAQHRIEDPGIAGAVAALLKAARLRKERESAEQEESRPV